MLTDCRDLVAAQHRDMYTALTGLAAAGVEDLDPELTRLGVRVKTTEHGWVLLVREIVNWRVVDARNDPIEGVPTGESGWPRGWCYGGPGSFLSSALAAVRWSGMPDTEPFGWVRSVHDRRRHGEPLPGIRQE